MTTDTDNVQFWNDLNRLFTAVFQIDEQGRIVRSSALVRRFQATDGALESNFFELFDFKRPTAFDGTFAGAKNNKGKLFLAFSESIGLAVRGQMMDFSHHGLAGLCFVGVPWLWWMQSNNPDTPLLFNDFPIHDAQMDQLFFMTTQQTMVDDLQLVNDELLLAKNEVDQLHVSRSKYFHHISHEMRTPLNGIISTLALLKEDQHDHRTEELIRLGSHSASRLLEVINYTLDTASLETDDTEEQQELFDLNSIIDDSLALIQARALQKGIELRRAGQQYFEAPYRGRLQLLRQVLSNLLANAIKFTQEGLVVISAQMREAQADGRHLIAFSVVDEGPGIPEDDLVRVFEPFVTGVTEETQNEQGTGLGLNIVKRFVATLGGTVTVQSQPGEGSTFSFAIPLTPVENKNSDVSVRSYESDYQLTGTALVVDDMPINLTLNAQLLQTMGLTVDTASSGKEAVAKVMGSPGRFDAVFMDLDMPEVSGFEAAQQILALPMDAVPRIIALSAHSSHNDRQRASEAGMDRFIVKPFVREDIIDAVQDWLPMSPKKDINRVPEDSSEQAFLDASSDQKNNELDGVLSFEAGKIESLIQELGVAVTKTLVSKFLAESSDRWDGLQKAMATDDVDVTSRETHTLGSSCLTFGLLAAGQRFRYLEAQVTAGKLISPADLAAVEGPLAEGIWQLEAALQKKESS